jgi:hypothetical protein
MYLRSDRNNIFCLKEDFIMADTGLSQNVVRAAKRLLIEFGWIIKTGMRSQIGRWDTSEYEVRIGKAPTGAQKVCSGKFGHRSPESVLPSGAQKVFRTVDTHTPVPPQDAVLGVRGVSPRDVPSEARRVPATADHAGDAIAFVAARPLATASLAGADASKAKTENLNPMGAAPPNPRCGDMGVYEFEDEESIPEFSEARCCATYLWFFLRGRKSLGEKITILPRWEEYWSADFQRLLDQGASSADIELAIWASQVPGSREFYIRSKSIVDQFELLTQKGQRLEHLKHDHQCPYCYCFFSLGSELKEHYEVCTEDPGADPDDIAGEEAMYAAEDLIAQGAVTDPLPDLDPFAEARVDQAFDDNGEPVWDEEGNPVMVREVWSDPEDLNYELPPPFKTPARGFVKPDKKKGGA